MSIKEHREVVIKSRIRHKNEQKILAAAEEVFALKSFDGATMDEIAARAGLSKPNVHYYYKTKEILYEAVLDRIGAPWSDALIEFAESDDPKVALGRYIAAKLDYSRLHPVWSRVWAQEMIRGAPQVRSLLRGHVRNTVNAKAAIIQKWIEQKKLRPDVDPHHLIFLIWAATQHYADFSVQVEVILRKRRLTRKDYDHIEDFLSTTILRGILPSDE